MWGGGGWGLPDTAVLLGCVSRLGGGIVRSSREGISVCVLVSVYVVGVWCDMMN